MDLGKITSFTLKNWLMISLGRRFQDKIIVVMKMMKVMMVMMRMMVAIMFL